MKSSIKYPLVLLAALVLAVVTISPAFASGDTISVSIDGIQSTVPLSMGSVPVPDPKQANFTKIEQISGIYLDIDNASINTSTLTGHFLMLSPPFYLNGNHELNAMYGTFTKDQTSNTSRMEYTMIYHGAWQWVNDPADSNKVMIRLGKEERHWYTLWMVPMYTVYFRDNVHVTTQNLGRINTATISILDHTFNKIWV